MNQGPKTLDIGHSYVSILESKQIENPYMESGDSALNLGNVAEVNIFDSTNYRTGKGIHL